MELVYKSFDGKIFNSEHECLEHEGKGAAFKMFNIKGQLTTCYDDALLIYINNYNEVVAEIFADNGMFFEGDPDDGEWWAYSVFHDGYVEVTDVFKMISNKTSLEMKKLMGV
jgi:hypothetical protein